ncbi:hypothetical protein ACFU3E_25900 [Streptomyces sp. NPDC057424]|uniref:hypothetical protein n=1 Tax=Streptomyces sp. NPDC057424 TaxID=3346127 RepID=UPI0036928E6F
MTARNDDDRRHGERDGGGEYDGMDPLMAVLAGDPVPEEARRDAAFMAAHDAAAADVALLRRQLGLLGDTLARAGEAEAGADTGTPAERTEPGPGATAGSGPGGLSAAAGGEGAAEPGGGGGSPVTALSSRRRTRPAPRAVALKGLVAAVGASLVIGMGWLVTQSGGMGAGGDQGAASDSAGGRPQTSGEDAKLGHAGYLACARIVVEGTVAGVETLPGTGRDRITLDVARYYKPDKGRKRITFPVETGVEPRLRAGDHVLVGIPGGQAGPDMWTTGEKEIARDRAWITEALPASRTSPCR